MPTRCSSLSRCVSMLAFAETQFRMHFRGFRAKRKASFFERFHQSHNYITPQIAGKFNRLTFSCSDTAVRRYFGPIDFSTLNLAALQCQPNLGQYSDTVDYNLISDLGDSVGRSCYNICEPMWRMIRINNQHYLAIY